MVQLDPTIEKAVSAETWADVRSGPALFVFTSSLQLLYLTLETRKLCEGLNRRRVGVARGVVPVEVMTLCNDLLKEFKYQHNPKDCERVQTQRVIGEPGHSVLVRGFGLPGLNGLQDARILIVMEAMVNRKQSMVLLAKEHYNLTDRELDVLASLSKGQTNKEIANNLAITEYTVKEHIKHLMRKTHTTTRTGLLASIILATAEPMTAASSVS